MILCMTFVAVCLVHLRRQETRLQHKLQVLEFTKPRIQRSIWERQVRISQLATPDNIRNKIKSSSIDVSPLPAVDSHRQEEPYVTEEMVHEAAMVTPQ